MATTPDTPACPAHRRICTSIELESKDEAFILVEGPAFACSIRYDAILGIQIHPGTAADGPVDLEIHTSFRSFRFQMPDFDIAWDIKEVLLESIACERKNEKAQMGARE